MNIKKFRGVILAASLIGPGSGGSPSAPATPSNGTTTTTTGTSVSSTGGSSGTATAADLAFCVTETNRYRAMAGAREDGQGGVPHQHFDRLCCSTSTAENQLHRLPYLFFGSVERVVRDGLAGFFSEGPTGGHYQNIVGRFTQMGCGMYLNGAEITFVQDFR